MLKKRLFVIAFVVAAASLGIPTQVSAAPSTPKSLMAVRTVASAVSPGQTVTLSVPMPWRANMLGLSYLDKSHSGAGVGILTRAHTSGGWSVWEELGANDNGATGVEAAHESQRVTTEPLWVGTADQVEVRISVAKSAGAIHNVRVHLINSLGDAKPQSTLARAFHATVRFLSMRAAPATTPAQAATGQPAIITRAQWGANPAYLNLPCPGTAPDLQVAFVHHTDTTNSYTKSQSAGIVRGIYAYHTNTRGYCDIAYNFLIDKYGQIFEGRNGGITNNVIGAHTGGYNYRSVGVALLGNYSTAKPSGAMLGSLINLLAWRLDVAHTPPTGTVYMKTGTGNDHRAAGTVVRFNRIAGHRDASYTSCPGSYVYKLLSWIRSRVAAIGLPKIYSPVVTLTNVRRDGDTSNEWTRITAAFSTTANWTLTFADANGVIRRTANGTGASVKVYWGGEADDGSRVLNGIYHWTLNATDASGHAAMPAGGLISVVNSHPDGTVLSDATGRYVIEGGAARAIDPTAYASNFGMRAPVTTGPDERARYTAGSAYGLREGTLLSDSSTTPATYYIWSGGALHVFKNGSFTALGYATAAAIPVTPTYVTSLGTLGTDITSLTQHPDGTLVKSLDGKTFSVVQGGALHPISALARASWYRSNEAVTVAVGDPPTIGTPFAVRDGAFIKATDGGAPWLVSDGTKHRFVSSAFATLMGYTTSMQLTASATDINAIPTGARIG